MICGAGFAGLIAAHVFQREPIYEAMPEPTASHKALLRFRNDSVSKLTGIDFKRVTVHKGIWYDMRFHQPNIQLCNLHSIKTLNKIIGNRSIWNIDTVERFVAPETLYEQLVEQVGTRITWNSPCDFKSGDIRPIINTAPLPIVCDGLGIIAPFEMERDPITVIRYRAAKTDTHQTIYYPDPAHTMYRASITGDLVICEFVGEPAGNWFGELCESFQFIGLDPMGTVKQSYGKILAVDDNLRKQFLHKLTAEYNIFSIGRFATWRNVLLDDLVNDAAFIKKLLNASPYERQKAAI